MTRNNNATASASLENGLPILDYLFNQSQITQKIFATYLADLAYQSTVEIGGYTTTKMANPNNVYYMPLAQGAFFWEIKVEAFRVGSIGYFTTKNITADYQTPNDTRAIVDTGTTALLVPYSVYQKLVDLIVLNIKVETNSGYLLGPCDVTVYPSLFLYVNGMYIEITPSTYVSQYSTGIPNMCIIWIV